MIGIRLHYLTFTGPNIEPAELGFSDGLNIVYGASNTGKSFAAQAILFMLGATEKLPLIEEVTAYDAVWLGISLPDRDITLYRATRGGNLKLYEGLVKADTSNNAAPKTLRGKNDNKRKDTVSYLLLNAIGLADKQIVVDGNGKKEPLCVRTLSPYAVVHEKKMIDDESPIFSSSQYTKRSFEQNLFKLLITGTDDSATVTATKLSERKIAKAAKLEFMDELIAQLDTELGQEAPKEKEAEEQLTRLDQSTENLFSQLQDIQNTVDTLVIKRRSTVDHQHELQGQLHELNLTLQRFAKLQEVYSSDLQRLESIEEGGYVLVAMANTDCPVCGASPDDQKHNHAAEEISMAYKAAAAEAIKIKREQQELEQTIDSLESEAHSLNKTITECTTEIERLDKDIQSSRPQEAALRDNYEQYALKRTEVSKILDLYQRRTKLLARRTEVEAEPTKRKTKDEALSMGPELTTLFKFGEEVKAVLTAWHFPNAEKAQFDAKINDITIAGKPRSSNGKGVRAILHTAFNVAVITYCIKHHLPHPGFLILDTPLVTYREPMHSKHGDLSEDEIELKAAGIAEHFYRHLASLKDEVQFIVIENADPPVAIRDLAYIETFTGSDDNGRFGLLAASTS